MDDKTKIADATYGSDLSGLKLDKDKTQYPNPKIEIKKTQKPQLV